MWMQWSHLPWNVFKSPFLQWKELPTFLLIEYTCFLLVIISLIHACKNGRNHVLIWIGSFITGSANDIFFMALPFVDNFWQAQATIMLTPRLPLYICCVYNIFLYYSTVASWRLGLENKWSEACVTGLLSLLIYYPYDLIGAKHLWWTWHTTDPPISHRILGVPLGSSLWILTFSACFSLILSFLCGKLKLKSIHYIILLSALITTPLMMIFMAFLQFVSLEKQGEPTVAGFIICLSIYSIVILLCSVLLISPNRGFKWLEHRSYTKWDPILAIVLLIYYIVLIGCGNLFYPEQFISTGVHQPLGPCNVSEIDLTGLSRDKYACLNNLRSDWNFHCLRDQETELINKTSEGQTAVMHWYSVCGTPHTSKTPWFFVLNLVCGMALLLYSIIYFLIPIYYKLKGQKKFRKTKKMNSKRKVK